MLRRFAGTFAPKHDRRLDDAGTLLGMTIAQDVEAERAALIESWLA
ncbi:hypothetical protein [Mycolicibacterium fortuitum]|nr:hypothetical protein [Mycolicibacterium fortuitum]